MKNIPWKYPNFETSKIFTIFTISIWWKAVRLFLLGIIFLNHPIIYLAYSALGAICKWVTTNRNVANHFAFTKAFIVEFVDQIPLIFWNIMKLMIAASFLRRNREIKNMIRYWYRFIANHNLIRLHNFYWPNHISYKL